MCKKLMFLISFVFVLGIVTSAVAGDVNWTNDYPWSILWLSPWNWDPETPLGGPEPGDIVYIRAGTAGPAVDTDATAAKIYGPRYEGGDDQAMQIVKDANLIVTGDWTMKGVAGDAHLSTINMADSAKVILGGRFANWSGPGNLILNMIDDASLIFMKDFRCGNHDENYSELNMSDNAYMYVGAQNNRIHINKGEFHFDLSGNAILETARLRARNLTAGVTSTITVSDSAQIIVYGDYFNIGEGENNSVVNVEDDAVVDVTGYFGLGTKGSRTLNMSGQLINTSGDFKIVSGGSTGFSTVNLTSGVINTEGALTAATDNWVINICGDGVWILDGDVVDAVLAQADEGHWYACPQEDCFGGISGRGTLMVDYDNVNTGKTTVWSELNLEAAWAPQPADGATGVPSIGTLLCWCHGEGGAISHLFLSTDEDAVANRDPAAYQGALHGVNCFDPGVLQLCTTYYWAVDEQDGGIIITPGDVWSFQVECCRKIEDFEAYTTNPDYVWDVWVDGCGDVNGFGGNATGSCISLSMDVLHDGAKALTYTYENEPYGLWDRDANYSEATRTFDPPMDLTLTGEVMMVVYFYGDPDNDLTNMWVLLNGSVADMALYGDNGEDPADIQSPEWIDWNFLLSGFAGVDLSSVATVSLGFGDVAGNIADSARGIVRIDDISVCPERCIPRWVDHIFDLNDDCISDMIDVGILCMNFLDPDLQ